MEEWLNKESPVKQESNYEFYKQFAQTNTHNQEAFKLNSSCYYYNSATNNLEKKIIISRLSDIDQKPKQNIQKQQSTSTSFIDTNYLANLNKHKIEKKIIEKFSKSTNR